MSEKPYSPAKLARLLRLEKYATPGPWQVDVLDKTTNIESKSWTVGTDLSNDDAEYIVAACNAVPHLLKALAKAEADRDKAVAFAQTLCDKARPVIEAYRYGEDWDSEDNVDALDAVVRRDV